MATNRDLLKEAIADAKAVKEMAIANAKTALEEAFTPRLKEMLSAKIQEMDEEDVNEMKDDDTMEEGMYEEDDKDAMKEETSEPHGNIGAQTPEGEPLGFLEEEDDKDSMEEGEELDEVDLEELLAELEKEEKEEKVEETLNEAEEEEEVEDEEESEEEEGEPLDLEDMTDEDLKKMIEDVIADMIESGELEAGDSEAKESEEEGEEMEVSDEEEVDLTELLKEIEEEMEKDTLKEGKMADLKNYFMNKFEDFAKENADKMLPFLQKGVALAKKMNISDPGGSSVNENSINEDKVDQAIKDLEAAGEEAIEKETSSLDESLNEGIVSKILKGVGISGSVGSVLAWAGFMVKAAIGAGMYTGGLPAGVISAILVATLIGSGAIYGITRAVEEYAKEKAGKQPKTSVKELENELSELRAENKSLKSDLNEAVKETNATNLLNAKLLYTNKIFRSKNLNESQKVKVLESFDKANTVKETKLVYETLSEGLKVKKNTIKENLGRASKSTTIPTTKKPIVESNDVFARMQKLAGIIK